MHVVGWNSPLVPLLLVLAVILCWCWLQGVRVRRVVDVENQWDPIGVHYAAARIFNPQSKVPDQYEWMDHLWQSLKREDERLLETLSQWICWPLSRELRPEGRLQKLGAAAHDAWTTLPAKIWAPRLGSIRRMRPTGT